MASARRTHLILFLILFVLISVRPLFACPMCTELLEHGANAAKAWRFGLGIAWSIVLMLAMPFLMMGTLVWTIVRAQKRKKILTEELSGGIKN